MAWWCAANTSFLSEKTICIGFLNELKVKAQSLRRNSKTQGKNTVSANSLGLLAANRSKKACLNCVSMNASAIQLGQKDKNA